MSDLDHKVLEACHRIEALYHETNGKCYISFSGGKDSTVLLALTKLCIDAYTLPEEGIRAVYSNTGIEMGVTVDFVNWCKNNWYKNIEIIRPEHSFDWVIKNKGKPMLSKLRAQYLNRWERGMRTEAIMTNFIEGVTHQGARARSTVLADRDFHMLHPDFKITATDSCCSYLKKKPFAKYGKDRGMKGTAIGLRIAEGGARQVSITRRVERGEKICTTYSGDLIKKMPIVDWTDENVEEFIKQYNVPLSDAYTKYGFDRTGCMACPFAKDVDRNLEYLFRYEPNRYKAIMHWLRDVYIAQNVVLPFDQDYEREREKTWQEVYEPMRREMLLKYRPNSRLIKDYQEIKLDI